MGPSKSACAWQFVDLESHFWSQLPPSAMSLPRSRATPTSVAASPSLGRRAPSPAIGKPANGDGDGETFWNKFGTLGRKKKEQEVNLEVTNLDAQFADGVYLVLLAGLLEGY